MSDIGMRTGFRGEIHPFFEDPTNYGTLVLVPKHRGGILIPDFDVQVDGYDESDPKKLEAAFVQYDENGSGSGEVHDITGARNFEDVRHMVIDSLNERRNILVDEINGMDSATEKFRSVTKRVIVGSAFVCLAGATIQSLDRNDVVEELNKTVDTISLIGLAAGVSVATLTVVSRIIRGMATKPVRSAKVEEYRRIYKQKMTLFCTDLVEKQ